MAMLCLFKVPQLTADGGNIATPDLQVEGFTVFGTNTAAATSVTSGWGNVYIDGSLQLGSNLVVNGSATGMQNVATEAISFTYTNQTVTAAVPISPAASYIRITGNGGHITMSANPQISAGYPGQLIFIQGTDNSQTVTISNGNGVKTAFNQPFKMGRFDIIEFIYDPVETTWVELNRSNNSNNE